MRKLLLYLMSLEFIKLIFIKAKLLCYVKYVVIKFVMDFRNSKVANTEKNPCRFFKRFTI